MPERVSKALDVCQLELSPAPSARADAACAAAALLLRSWPTEDQRGKGEKAFTHEDGRVTYGGLTLRPPVKWEVHFAQLMGQ